MLTKHVAAAVITVLGLSAGAGTASAHGFRHIDELARTLQGQTRALEGEFAEHFRHAAHFRHLMGDAREMAGLAAHIHEVAHHGGSPYHLRSDLRNLDRLFHHLEEMVAHIERDAYHGEGHVHGDTRHVRGLMRSISGTLHHLEGDVERITAYRHGGPPVSEYGGSVSIGGRGFRVVIGGGR